MPREPSAEGVDDISTRDCHGSVQNGLRAFDMCRWPAMVAASCARLCGRDRSDDNDACKTAGGQSFLLTSPLKREDADGDQYFGVVDTAPASTSRDGGGNRGARLHQLHQAADHAHAECRCSRHLGHGHTIRRGARGTRIAGHEGSRGCRLRASPAPTTSTPSITDGISSTTITFRLETDTDRALNDVKDAVTRIRANLPRGIDEPMIQRVDIAGLPILTYAAIAPGKTPEQLSWFVDDVVIRALQGVRGVGTGRSHRERRARDPGRARSGSAAGRWLDAARCQPPASRQQRRSRRRARRDRRPRPGHPHPRRRQDGRRSGCDKNRPAGRRRSAAWTIWGSSPTRLRSREPLRDSTAHLSSASTFYAQKAQAMSSSRTPLLLASRPSRQPTRTSTSS